MLGSVSMLGVCIYAGGLYLCWGSVSMLGVCIYAGGLYLCWGSRLYQLIIVWFVLSLTN